MPFPLRRLAAGLAALGLAAVLRWNGSSSMPRGLYLVLPLRHPRPGDLVLVCLPPEAAALFRHHVPEARGSCPGNLPPLLKTVAALGGARLRFGPEGVTLDRGLLPSSAPLAVDRRGVPLPHPPFGTSALPPGTVWLYAPYDRRSFDSRYFGPVPAAALRALAVPLAVAAPAPPPPHPFRVRLFSPALD